MPKHYNVLFLCTGNSARSIMAEALLNLKGRPNFTAFSADSYPSGTVRPEALRQLEFQLGALAANLGMNSRNQTPQAGLRLTVCDNAAKEVCPVWPGQPMTAHWGILHPAAVEGSAAGIERVHRDAFFMLDRRISLFLALPIEKLSKLALTNDADINA